MASIFEGWRYFPYAVFSRSFCAVDHESAVGGDLARSPV
jgi:hypothetical protein